MRQLAAIAVLFCLPSPLCAGEFSSLATGILALYASKPAPTPGPAPTPKPSGICDNCNGTGKLGDGTISVTCPVCDGTGRKQPAVSAPRAAVVQPSKTIPARPAAQPNPYVVEYPHGTYRWTCTAAGSCQWLWYPKPAAKPRSGEAPQRRRVFR